ncbi:MAG TPA: arylesterase [Geobacteraceae bacterium]|nr:arylesterase [Geobacteraceae bacterium]
MKDRERCPEDGVRDLVPVYAMKGRVKVMTGIAVALLGLMGVCESVGEAGSLPGKAHAGASGTIVALGDSLTAGFGVKEKEAYPSRLERKLHEAGYQWRVINSGVSGETTGDILARLDKVLEVRPDIVILEIGVNDGFMGIDPRLVSMNIEEMLRALKAQGITVVLAGMRMFGDQENEYCRAFAAIYPDLAGKHDLTLIPYFLAGVAGDPSLNKADGIHPGPKGYRIVVDTVYPYVIHAMEKRSHK